MKSLLGLSLVLLVGCGGGGELRSNKVTDSSKKVTERQAFNGYYNLNGGSGANCIYLDEKAPGIVDLESDCQSLVSLNPQNNTLGQFPRISFTNIVVVNGEIRYTRNLTYTAGQDLEHDVSGANQTGSRRTDVHISFNAEGSLVLHLKVYANADNNNLNFVVIDRTFTEVK